MFVNSKMKNNNTSSIISLVKLDTVHLYLDNKKNILYFDVLSSRYCKQNTITVLEYFKNFWLLAKEEQSKYYLIVKIDSIGVYPLSFYSNLVECLKNLNDIFKKYLHSCAFLCNGNSPLIILKPLFSLYSFARPFVICKTYEEVLINFDKPENKL